MKVFPVSTPPFSPTPLPATPPVPARQEAPYPELYPELFTPAVGRKLAQVLLETRAERDRYRQLYEETLATLTAEQQAHRRTRTNLLQALRDVLP